MQTFNEDKLTFAFQDAWRVCKYDDTNFYRRKLPTDISLRAVDFIASPSAFTKLILIEVKDFRGYSTDNKKGNRQGNWLSK